MRTTLSWQTITMHISPISPSFVLTTRLCAIPCRAFRAQFSLHLLLMHRLPLALGLCRLEKPFCTVVATSTIARRILRCSGRLKTIPKSCAWRSAIITTRNAVSNLTICPRKRGTATGILNSDILKARPQPRKQRGRRFCRGWYLPIQPQPPVRHCRHL